MRLVKWLFPCCYVAMPLGLLFISLLCGALGALVARVGFGLSWPMSTVVLILLANLIVGVGLFWLGRHRRK
ncbi:hypothetical protein CUV01_07050 [Paracoccus tegillarcae]|uniref:Uncharacterized protein n=1 Tax=Paracoccus tegillarcae TaxID=1529068 RepID=A0A2K9EFR2_9RHOB|nr:hypothetical protein CUV01_07050 [Paracoccus tegillarcae]